MRSKVKTELFNITRDLVSKRAYSKMDVLKEFHRRHPSINTDDERHLIEIGLRVLAGRVRASRVKDSDQYELLTKYGIREFEEIVIDKGGKRVRELNSALQLTVEEYDRRIPLKKSADREKSSSEKIAEFMLQMKQQNFKGNLGDFLRKLGNQP